MMKWITLLMMGSRVMATAIDNTAAADLIAKSAVTLSGAGNYHFTNSATGKTLSFAREGVLASAVTNVFAILNGGPLAIQFHEKNAGQARMSGGNNKCISAQWSATQEGGVDNAAVSYACGVGTGLLTGTSTLEITKQWWYIVPINSAATQDSAKSPAKVAKISKSSKSSKSSATKSASSSSHSASASATPKSKLESLSFVVENAVGPSTSNSTLPPNMNPNNDASAVVPSDRRTWICKHAAAWLLSHPEYVTIGGHTECAYSLALAQSQTPSVNRFVKKSHLEMAKNLESRAAKASTQEYRLVPVDHLHDQTTRCISGRAISTPGGYTSSALDVCDETDQAQRWVVTTSTASASL